VRRLFAPAGGALLASTDQQLLRTDDAGQTWAPVALPAATSIAAVAPTDPDILYAAGAQGMYRTDDQGTTWRLILEYTPDVGVGPGQLAVGAADHDRLYLALQQAPGPASGVRLLRSRDAGQTWQPLPARQASLCTWSVLLLQVHPADPDRLFQSAACLAGRTFGASLQQSQDAGTTWRAVFNPEPYRTLGLGYPGHLVVGQGSPSGPFYLAANHDARLGGAALMRSDDDGTTWSEVLAFHGGGTPGYRQPEDPPDAPNVRIGGLVIDAANADQIQVYVGLVVYDRYPPRRPVGGGVLVSADGGASWAALGRDLGGVNDLVLSPETQSLYAATVQGLWRLDLAASGGAP
jgi:photosystem II stability/assembly factor-like uncharacterized protein